MAKVVKHQAKDGSLHDSAKVCDAHDRKLRIAPAMEKFVGSLTATAPGVGEEAHTGSPIVRLEDLPKFLADHAEQIRDAVNGALVTRRPRKPKAAPAAKTAPSSKPAANEPNKEAAA